MPDGTDADIDDGELSEDGEGTRDARRIDEPLLDRQVDEVLAALGAVARARLHARGDHQ